MVEGGGSGAQSMTRGSQEGQEGVARRAVGGGWARWARGELELVLTFARNKTHGKAAHGRKGSMSSAAPTLRPPPPHHHHQPPTTAVRHPHSASTYTPRIHRLARITAVSLALHIPPSCPLTIPPG